MNAPDRASEFSRFATPLDVPRVFVDVLGNREISAIDLVGGNPAHEAIPREELGAAFGRAFADASATALQYSAPGGLPALIAWLAAREGVAPERIIITNGALHGLALTVLALVDPGDAVVVDDPVYPVFRRVLELGQATIVPVPVDAEGIDVERLEELLRSGLRPRLVYTVPQFQNPTGVSLSAGRRDRLVELAEEFGFVVLWDDPYRRSRWTNASAELSPPDGDRVVRVDTFSKTLGPGLRLGWMVVPDWLAPKMLAIRARTDQHPSTLTQSGVLGFVSSSDDAFDIAALGIAQEHRRRAFALTQALRDMLGDRVSFAAPDGGFFLWTRVEDPDVPMTDLRRRAVGRGTSFTSGTAFAAAGGSSGDRHIRLGFTSTPVDQIPSAVSRLAQAFDDVTAAKKGATP